MPKTINIKIRDRVVLAVDQTEYICGNSDFIVNFDFDEEWNQFETKTARFVYDGKFVEVMFQGNQCQVPVIYDTCKIFVGVYAGSLQTTTHAVIVARKSILCHSVSHADPDSFRQMIDLFNEGLDEFREGRDEIRQNVDQTKESEENVKISEQNSQKNKETAQEAANVAAQKALEVAEYATNGMPPVLLTAFGEEITLKDSADRQLKGLNIFGKTTQLQSTGAQMVDSFTARGTTVNGIKMAANEDGSFTFKGTATKSDQSTMASLPTNITLAPGTYTLSVDKPLPMRIRFNTTSFLSLAAGKTSVTSTITSAFTIKNIAAHYTNGVEYDETFYLMLNEGDTALPWEPYTGGLPAPAPDNPQDLKNACASGEINVSISGGDAPMQTISVSTPNGLPGVPVESGGNYTDENGQQWVCDEIDFKRGVYIKRCAVDVLDHQYDEEGDVYRGGYCDYDKENIFVEDADGYEHMCVLVKCNYIGVSGAICNALPITTDVADLGVKDCLYIGESNGFVVSLPSQSDDFWLTSLDLTSKGTPFTVIRGMTSEYWTETPLTAEQIVEFTKMHSLYPSTVVSNDCGAEMGVEYVADTKSYIDNKFEELKATMNSVLGVGE